MKKIELMLACVVLLILASACSRYLRKTSGAVAQMAAPVRVSLENTDAAEPAIAAAQDGTAYVAWVEHRAKKEADVFVLHVDREGQAMGAPVRVNAQAGEATAWRGDPPTLAVAPDGTVYTGWTARVAGERHANNLYLSASRDGGRSFEPPVKVNDDQKPGGHGMHSLAVSKDGRIHLAWLDERNIGPPVVQQAGGNQKPMEHMEQNSEVFTAFSTDGGRKFSANRRVASEACPCCKTSLAVAPDGHVYIGWRQVLPGEYRHIAVSSSTDRGETYSQPVIVSDDQWVFAACPVSGPTLNVTTEGTLRVMWYTAGERGTPGLYWADSKDGGKSFSASRLFAGGQAYGPAHLAANGRGEMVVIWGNNDGGTPRVLASTLVAGGKDSPPLFPGAELPSAAMAGDQLFIGYLVNTGDRRAIWVARAKPVA
jgi:(2Fe-2S) ferredoxin